MLRKALFTTSLLVAVVGLLLFFALATNTLRIRFDTWSGGFSTTVVFENQQLGYLQVQKTNVGVYVGQFDYGIVAHWPITVWDYVHNTTTREIEIRVVQGDPVHRRYINLYVFKKEIVQPL